MACSFAPVIVTGFHYHWVYRVAPFLGSLLGTAFDNILKWSESSMQEKDSPYLLAKSLSDTENPLPNRDAAGRSAGSVGIRKL
ncbi:uncharacterized protein F5891DRAFT_569169 [Suillus fuscotomentosus]|uniref:Uncharacterized protein n=1 Tax=Suillus fuscotomentosus TaxID=1912939 RepID=A0AAD4DZD4_9AGAM|nr:uncharacterized protein F5891DRAFT_569169 [Suillus fuscotomentosus]KAG1896905.1 hypothetical protein F5891DRAFT_569169 [Suillus fuscotomentosus]